MDCPLKFATYVGDGDSAVGREVLRDPNVKKLECQYHFRRSCKGKLLLCFQNSVAMIPKKRKYNKKTGKLTKQTYYARYPLRCPQKKIGSFLL